MLPCSGDTLKSQHSDFECWWTIVPACFCVAPVKLVSSRITVIHASLSIICSLIVGWAEAPLTSFLTAKQKVVVMFLSMLPTFTSTNLACCWELYLVIEMEIWLCLWRAILPGVPLLAPIITHCHELLFLKSTGTLTLVVIPGVLIIHTAVVPVIVAPVTLHLVILTHWLTLVTPVIACTQLYKAYHEQWTAQAAPDQEENSSPMMSFPSSQCDTTSSWYPSCYTHQCRAPC